MKSKKLLIFTDLDGSLLDHDTYSFEGAKKVLNKIKKRDIPLILTSSKTRFEIEEIKEKLQIDFPFICENGAAIFFPKYLKNYLPKEAKKIDKYYAIVLGEEYKKILEFKKRFNIKGFSDLSDEEVAKLTGLDIKNAKNAKKREFSEPFLLENEDLEKIEKEAKKFGLKITKGGRFFHIIGINQDKGKALNIVANIYKKYFNQDILVVGVGDSKNDIEMLKSADIPILIKKFDQSYENISLKNLIKSKYPGSKGWGECVGVVLKREDAKDIFFKAVEAVLPQNVIKDSVKLDKDTLYIKNRKYELKNYKNIYILGAGKASGKMAEAIEAILKEKIKKGIVISTEEKDIGNIKILKGSHPIPDEKSFNGAKSILKLVEKIDENDLAIFLLSGGASALMEYTIPPISLQDLQKTNELLLKSGADIDEINIVRKHISMIKGGKLATKCKSTAAVLVISDVIGDDLEVIGSAPCYIDRSTFEDAKEVLIKYDILKKVPKSVIDVIENGIENKIDETLKIKKKNIEHFILASNKIALNAAKIEAKKLGYKAYIVTDKMCKEARNIGEDIIKRAKKVTYFKDFVWLFGGESVVHVKGKGKGGRNQEMALAALKEIDDYENIEFLSAGTDGIDGNSNAAGALADFKIYEKSKELNLDIDSFLENNDSFHFFEKCSNLLITGYSGTNVMDIAVLIKEEPKRKE
ncbi:HAD-IIB family hydrolase [Nitrosophilus kaiyonis]|uniref:HAD-IIB family hydrolase n=1 Tax=Nitrosophilus kaiyonis TaxID=2930200 RepID=UPI00248F548B|nr:HAD-IIB family hydrolase [Nitrosophilus kaiyonis]